MKKYLLPCDVNWYRANMHCHSTISDGKFTPEEIKEEYKKMGYSIVAYTDHEVIVDHSDLNDEEFLAITSSEYSINDSKTSFEYTEGQRVGLWQGKKVLHFGVYAKDPHNVFHYGADEGSVAWWKRKGKDINIECDGYARQYAQESINETIKRLNEGGFLVSLNHPNWSLNDMDDYLNMKGLWSLEILNYATERLTGAEYCPYIYDLMVRKGNYNLYCNMGDDNHNGDGTLNQSFGGSTIIGAKELKYDQIISALEKGEFYCASGKNPPKINSLYIEDNIIKIDCSPATNIFVTGLGRSFRSTGGEDITHAEFKLEPQDILFRITVRDKYGNNAHTHYYKVEDYYEVQE